MDGMCHVPIRATMVIGADGRAVMTDAEWVEVPADAIARLLIAAFGVDISTLEDNRA